MGIFPSLAGCKVHPSFGSHPLATFSSWHSGLAQTSGKPSPASDQRPLFSQIFLPSEQAPHPGWGSPCRRPGRLSLGTGSSQAKSRGAPRASHCRAARFAPGPSLETRQVFLAPFTLPPSPAALLPSRPALARRLAGWALSLSPAASGPTLGSFCEQKRQKGRRPCSGPEVRRKFLLFGAG